MSELAGGPRRLDLHGFAFSRQGAILGGRMEETRETGSAWISRRALIARGGSVAGSLALASVATACQRETDTGQENATQGDGFTFYSVTHGAPGDPFWAVYRKGVRDASKLAGVGFKDLAPEKFSVQAVANLLDSAVAANPDGIIATITDPAALETPLEQAEDKGIPVIAVDTPDLRPADQRVPYLFYIGGDERLGGRVAAEAVLETVKPRRAVCANQEVGNVSLEARCQGWSDVMSQAGAAVDKLPISGANPTESAEVLRNYFKSHPDAEALLTVGPQGAAPALQVFEEEGLVDKVVHASFDLSEEQLAAIKAGQIFSTISTQQYLIGFEAVLLQWQHKAHGFNLAADLLTGPFLITKENVTEVEDQVEQQFM